MPHLKPTFTLFALFLLPTAASTQDCVCEHLQMKVAEVERDLAPRLGVVRLHRREDLEDRVFVPKSNGTNLESPIFFYQVEDQRYYLLRGEVAQTAQTGAYNSYVVISEDASHVYRLGGFPEAEVDFSSLVKDYPFPAVLEKSDAQQRALFCTETLYQLSPDWWILTEGQIKLDLARHFFRIGATDPFLSAKRWWSGYQAKYPEFKPEARVSETGPKTFQVQIPYFLTHAEGSDTAEIRELKVEVRPDGTCHRE